ncbi:MAG: VOC family protein [Gammaproteobacteria bacterium]|nr:VOC family protein [Gammaproteobacteria bacterium]
MRIDKFKQIAINAENLDESVEFYEIILGAKLVARYDPPGLAFFDFDGTHYV